MYANANLNSVMHTTIYLYDTSLTDVNLIHLRRNVLPSFTPNRKVKTLQKKAWRHGVTRRRSTKRLINTRNLFIKNLLLKCVC